MATTKFIESGTAATQGFEFWSSTAGTVTSDGTTVRLIGGRSIKLNTASPAVSAIVRKLSIAADAGTRVTFWINLPSVTPSGNGSIISMRTAADGNVITVNLKTTGVLGCFGAGAPTVFGNTVLVANTWYRVSLAYTITSTTSFEFRVYLNGVLEITISSNGTLSATASSGLSFILALGLGTNFIAYVSDIYVDNGTDLADPGNIGVTAKLPASTNANNWNTTLGDGSVNERPISQTNGKKDSSVSAQNQNYTLQTAAVGDVDISAYTLLARTAWVYMKQETAILGTTQMTDNGSNTTITPTTSAALYTLTTDSAAYPSNAAGIGMVSPGLAADPVDLYECGTIIAYYQGPVPKGLSEMQAIKRAAYF